MKILVVDDEDKIRNIIRGADQVYSTYNNANCQGRGSRPCFRA